MKNFMKNEDNKIFSQNVSSSYHLEDKKRAVPKLRFKGYNDEWKHYRLKDIVKIYDGTHQTPNYIEEGIKFVSVENISNLEGTNKYISKADYDKDFKIKPETNDVLMTRIGDIGTPAIIDTDENYAYYVSLALLKSNQELLFPKFFVQRILSESFQHELWRRTLHVAFPKKINKNEIGECNVFICSKSEQEKIASFLTLIDKKIEKQKELVELLKKYKRGLLSQIFSQKLRFKDAEGNDYPEWEEKQIKDIFTFYNGKAHEKEITENGKYIVVNSKFISTSGQVKKYINEMIVPLKKNDIVMVMSDVPNGKAMSKCYLIENDNIYSLNQRICALRTNMIAQYFIYQISRNQYFLKFDNGVSQTNLRKEDVLKCPVIVPIIKEQIKISNIISKLDNIIEKENILLDSYNYYKKGLLQKMFI